MWSGVRPRASGEGCVKRGGPFSSSLARVFLPARCLRRVPTRRATEGKRLDRFFCFVFVFLRLNIGSRSSGAGVGGVRQ